MPEENLKTAAEKPHHVSAMFQIRRCLLLQLYDYFKKFPYATIGLDQLRDDCQLEVPDLNWNIVYLEKSGWVELSKSYDEPPFIAASAILTAKGIDFIENETEFEKKLPIPNDRP